MWSSLAPHFFLFLFFSATNSQLPPFPARVFKSISLCLPALPTRFCPCCTSSSKWNSDSVEQPGREGRKKEDFNKLPLVSLQGGLQISAGAGVKKIRVRPLLFSQKRPIYVLYCFSCFLQLGPKCILLCTDRDKKSEIDYLCMCLYTQGNCTYRDGAIEFVFKVRRCTYKRGREQHS